MATAVSIISIASFSPLGNLPETVWENYLKQQSFIQQVQIGGKIVPAAVLSAELAEKVQKIRAEEPKYRYLDDSVLFAILASRDAVQKAGWASGGDFGVNIGSSRGATGLFEQHFTQYLETGNAAVQASPSTTLGNISSWVAQDLKTSGPDISHSITCSTALHAVLNGVAWLRAGMAGKFLAGGSEAPLTPFTIAQMKAMKIYSKEKGDFPCLALDLEKTKNTMVLGEGAAAVCLEPGIKHNALAYIAGMGYATEPIKHGASISADAECLQKSMQMALNDFKPQDVDAVVMHAPGTIKGDLSEYAAIQKVFGNAMPLLTTNKWKTGHTFGASGLLSLELALLMLQHNTFIPSPFYDNPSVNRDIKTVLVNAVGFGGNAVSLLVSEKP